MSWGLFLITSAIGLSIAVGVMTTTLWLLVSQVETERFAQRPMLWRYFAWLIEPLNSIVSPLVPYWIHQRLSRLLNRADLSRDLNSGLVIASIILLSLIGSIVLGVAVQSIWNDSSSDSGESFNLLALLCGGLALGVLPIIWINEQIARREAMILKQLPFFLDLIVLSVESGLNLSGALVETVEKGPSGVLRHELSLVLRDTRAGVARADALTALAGRVQLPQVSNLVGSLVAADRQGGSIGPLLRSQAEQRRIERFLKAEKLAMQAPVKMLFPLITCIFPCTFIVLFFPIFHRLVSEGWIK